MKSPLRVFVGSKWGRDWRPELVSASDSRKTEAFTGKQFEPNSPLQFTLHRLQSLLPPFYVLYLQDFSSKFLGPLWNFNHSPWLEAHVR